MPGVQQESRQQQRNGLPLQARVQLHFVKCLQKKSLEQAQSRVLGDEYVRAAKLVLQGLGFDIKHLEADKVVSYCPFVL